MLVLVFVMLAACSGGKDSASSRATSTTSKASSTSTSTSASPTTVMSTTSLVTAEEVAAHCTQIRTSNSAALPPVTGVEGTHGGGSGEVYVHWVPSTVDVTCYRVFRAVARDGDFELAGEVPVSGTTPLRGPGTDPWPYVFFDGSKFQFGEDTYAFVPRPTGCCFDYRVTAVDASGNESAPSETVCAQPLPEEPANGCDA